MPNACTTLIALSACSAYPALYPYDLRFCMNPLYMARVITKVITNITGNAKSKIRENHHPLKKAKNRPDRHIASES